MSKLDEKAAEVLQHSFESGMAQGMMAGYVLGIVHSLKDMGFDGHGGETIERIAKANLPGVLERFFPNRDDIKAVVARVCAIRSKLDGQFGIETMGQSVMAERSAPELAEK